MAQGQRLRDERLSVWDREPIRESTRGGHPRYAGDREYREYRERGYRNYEDDYRTTDRPFDRGWSSTQPGDREYEDRPYNGRGYDDREVGFMRQRHHIVHSS